MVKLRIKPNCLYDPSSSLHKQKKRRAHKNCAKGKEMQRQPWFLNRMLNTLAETHENSYYSFKWFSFCL